MGTEKQEKHTVSITFLFTSEGHEAIWEPWILFFWTSGFLTRPDTNSHRHSLVWDFCLSSLELSHKAKCQLTQAQSGFEAFVLVPWSFLTRPDADSHRQGHTTGSDIPSLFVVAIYTTIILSFATCFWRDHNSSCYQRIVLTHSDLSGGFIKDKHKALALVSTNSEFVQERKVTRRCCSLKTWKSKWPSCQKITVGENNKQKS
jgi:hypothetical protein